MVLCFLFCLKKGPSLRTAFFSFSSFQALVSSGRDDAVEPSSSTSFGLAARDFPAGHLPMAVLPKSLAEEVSRITALEADRPTSGDGRSVANPGAECAQAEGSGGSISSSHAGPGGRKETRKAGAAATAAAEGVKEMMLEDGALAVLADVIAPRPPGADDTESEEERLAAEALPPLEAPDDESLRLEALKAAVSMLQARPRAQAEFVRLGGYSRVCRFVHDLAAAGEQGGLRSPAAPSADPPAAERSRSRSKSRADSLPRGRSRHPSVAAGEPPALDAAFDAMFRLALDGHAVAAGARADGAGMVRTLLVLSARSPSLPVTLRAARSLQALLCVRPMNAVSLERQNGLGVIADAVAGLSFSVGSAEETSAGVELGLDREVAAAERFAWSVDDKREALSALNDVVRALAAVYSRQDARAVERYAGIVLSESTARYRVGASGKLAGTQCSACGATPAGGFEVAIRRCLSEGCQGLAGLCAECDETLHAGAGGDGHVRVPVTRRNACEQRDNICRGASSPEREDPAWAVEAGKALIKAMVVMLDDRESFGLPPTPDRRVGTGRNDAAGAAAAAAATAVAAEHISQSNTASGVLACMLQIVQDELLEPLHGRRGFTADEDDDEVDQSSNSADGRGDTLGLSSSTSVGWAEGWLLGALEVVARVVVRGDGTTVEDLSDAGGWGLLAHIVRAPLPPRHLILSRRHPNPPGVSMAGVDASCGGQENEGARARTSVGRGRGGECWSWQGGGSEAWTGWVGARRLALWIVREALLTGTGTAGQLRRSGGGNAVGTTTLLEQPAKWLIWLVRALVKVDPPRDDGPAGACSEDQVSC